VKNRRTGLRHDQRATAGREHARPVGARDRGPRRRRGRAALARLPSHGRHRDLRKRCQGQGDRADHGLAPADVRTPLPPRRRPGNAPRRIRSATGNAGRCGRSPSRPRTSSHRRGSPPRPPGSNDSNNNSARPAAPINGYDLDGAYATAKNIPLCAGSHRTNLGTWHVQYGGGRVQWGFNANLLARPMLVRSVNTKYYLLARVPGRCWLNGREPARLSSRFGNI
jgi:hypothetical protein